MAGQHLNAGGQFMALRVEMEPRRILDDDMLGGGITGRQVLQEWPFVAKSTYGRHRNSAACAPSTSTAE